MSWWKSLVKLVVRLVNRGVDKKEEGEKIREANLQAALAEAKEVSTSAQASIAQAVKDTKDYEKMLSSAKQLHAQAEAMLKAGPPKDVPKRNATPKPSKK